MEKQMKAIHDALAVTLSALSAIASDPQGKYTTAEDSAQLADLAYHRALTILHEAL